jgi:hypothetical protein
MLASRMRVLMPTSICACSNEILATQTAGMGKNYTMYQELFYLANELVVNCTRKSNAEKGTGCMSENPRKVTVSTPERDKLGI